jgi:hypothetical protein
MRNWFLFLLTVFYISVFSQATEELIYPVVPIADECHYAFDNNDSIQIISIADFQKIDSIWTTFNACLGYKEDRQNAASFTIRFKPLGNENGQDFFVNDGYLKTEYQSSLVYNIENLKPHEHIFFTEIHYERGGAMYQVPDVHMVIDSIVILELDTCWQYFPMGPAWDLSIPKDQFIKLLTDSFGYNTCTNTIEWHDTNVKISMTLTPSYVINAKLKTMYLDNFRVHNKSDMTEALLKIRELNNGDKVDFREAVYIKNGAYQYSKRYLITLKEKLECLYSFNLDVDNTSVLKSMIDSVRAQDSYTPICLHSSTNNVRYKIIYVPKDSPPTITSSSEEKMSYRMWVNLKKLSSGEKIIIEGIKSIDPLEGNTTTYKPIIIVID